MSDDSDSLRRALGDPRRLALLDAVLEHAEGLGIDELAAVAGAHPNTVRWHLGVLADAGLVSSRPEVSHGPGRPRIRYVASAAAAGARADEHRALATMLTDALACVDDAPARAADAGCAWGRHAVAGRTGEGGADHAEALAVLVDLLAMQGYQPELDGSGSIALRRCPFHDLAEVHPDLICSLHRGVLTGALEQLDAPVRLHALRPFVAPGLCLVDLVVDRPAADEDRPAGGRPGSHRAPGGRCGGARPPSRRAVSTGVRRALGAAPLAAPVRVSWPTGDGSASTAAATAGSAARTASPTGRP
jgi:predicted ArsR family transcriptional regulator